MNAQEQWLKLWRMYREAYKYHAEIGMYNLRDMMKTRYRREAALERRCERLDREVRAIIHDIGVLESILSDKEGTIAALKRENTQLKIHRHDPRVAVVPLDPRWSNDGT